MSVGIGVSDILYFVNQTLILYGQCKGAPAELQAAGRDVEQMRTALEILGEAIKDKMSFVAKQPAIALMIKHESKPLREDLVAMNIILSDYIDKSKNMGIVGRVRYAVLDRNKLLCIQTNLIRSRTNFGLMLDLINMKAHEQHARSDRNSIAKLEAILTKQTKEAEARKAEAKSREIGDAKLEDILQILQERLPPANNREGGTASPLKVLDRFEIELQKAGLSRKKAEAARLNAAQALTEHTSVPMPSLLHPKPQLHEKRRISDPSPQTGKDLRRSPSSRKASPHIWGSGGLPEKTKDYRILCVDGTHGIRAILAHTYLEVLRIWTANRTGRWLFKRVHSVGHHIDTNANTPIDPTAIQGVRELLPKNGYDWAKDYPNETLNIAIRMVTYKSHGLTAADLDTYDILLCFTRSDASHLAKLQAESKDPARIIVLHECRGISSEDCVKDPKKIRELISHTKMAIKRFITEELGDWSDSLERRTNYRTQEMVLPGRDLNYAGTGNSLTDPDKLKEIERKTGCAIKVARYKGGMEKVLVSIIGPRGSLNEAATLISPGTKTSSDN